MIVCCCWMDSSGRSGCVSIYARTPPFISLLLTDSQTVYQHQLPFFKAKLFPGLLNVNSQALKPPGLAPFYPDRNLISKVQSRTIGHNHPSPRGLVCGYRPE